MSIKETGARGGDDLLVVLGVRNEHELCSIMPGIAREIKLGKG
jgi:hypothetical protein